LVTGLTGQDQGLAGLTRGLILAGAMLFLLAHRRTTSPVKDSAELVVQRRGLGCNCARYGLRKMRCEFFDGKNNIEVHCP